MPETSSTPTAPVHHDAREDQRHSESLLEQFYTTLRVSHLALPPSNGEDASTTAVRERIKHLIYTSPRGWREAYEIEQLMPSVMSKAQLEIELDRRLAEAERLEVASAGTLKSRYEAKDVQEEDLRALLRTLLNDIQWFYEKRVRRRVLTRRYATRLAFLFLSSFFVFAVMVWLQLESLRPAGG